MKRTARLRLIASILIFAWLVGTLVLSRDQNRNLSLEQESLATALANGFEVGWLSRPDQPTHQHLFRRMKQDYFTPLLNNSRSLAGVVLTWISLESEQEVVLYPMNRLGQKFDGNLQSGTVRVAIQDPFRQPLTPSGFLYFQFEPSEARRAKMTFWLGASNVLLLLTLLLVWLSRLSRRFEASQFELEQKKRELIQLEQLALAGKLSAGLLHDLKKPIIHIREESREGFSDKFVEMVREQSELFLSMLRDSGLEGFAKRKSAAPEHCDVIDLVDRSLRLVAYERNDIDVAITTEPNVPFVFALPTRLMQVFSNLILNAYQAMSGHGNLKIHVASERAEGKRWAVVEFEDTGPGIAPENIKHIFEPFFTTGKEGSGLGLYISRTIIQELGGAIEVESKPGAGTRFMLRLPESPEYDSTHEIELGPEDR